MLFRNFSTSLILTLTAFAPHILADYWIVSTFSDQGCEDQIGDWSDDVSDGCIDLTAFTVNAQSIMFTGTEGPCGWIVDFFSDGGCDTSSLTAVEVQASSDTCYGITNGEFDAWESFNVIAESC